MVLSLLFYKHPQVGVDHFKSRIYSSNGIISKLYGTASVSTLPSYVFSIVTKFPTSLLLPVVLHVPHI